MCVCVWYVCIYTYVCMCVCITLMSLGSSFLMYRMTFKDFVCLCLAFAGLCAAKHGLELRISR